MQTYTGNILECVSVDVTRGDSRTAGTEIESLTLGNGWYRRFSGVKYFYTVCGWVDVLVCLSKNRSSMETDLRKKWGRVLRRLLNLLAKQNLLAKHKANDDRKYLQYKRYLFILKSSLHIYYNTDYREVRERRMNYKIHCLFL